MRVLAADGTVVREMPTPHMKSVLDEFDIEGHLYIVPDEMLQRREMDDQRARGAIVMVKDVTFKQWDLICRRHGCIGLIFYSNPTPVMIGFCAATQYWSGWPPQPPIPIVNIYGTDDFADAAFVIARYSANNGHLNVTISSNDFNDATALLQSESMRNLGIVGFAFGLWVVMKGLYKLGCFIVKTNWKLRAVPFSMLSVVVPEIVASIVLTLNFCNISTHSTFLPFIVSRYCITSWMQWSFLATAHLAYAMNDILLQDIKHRPSSIRATAVVISKVLLFLIFCFDSTVTIYACITNDTFVNSAFLLGIYPLVSFPVAISFIQFSLKVSDKVVKVNVKISDEEQLRRVSFTKRLYYSGIWILCSIAGTVVMAVFPQTSVSAYCYCYCWTSLLQLITSTFKMDTFRTPIDSPIYKVLHSRPKVVTATSVVPNTSVLMKPATITVRQKNQDLVP